jgi:hypothetical protein
MMPGPLIGATAANLRTHHHSPNRRVCGELSEVRGSIVRSEGVCEGRKISKTAKTAARPEPIARTRAHIASRHHGPLRDYNGALLGCHLPNHTRSSLTDRRHQHVNSRAPLFNVNPTLFIHALGLKIYLPIVSFPSAAL